MSMTESLPTTHEHQPLNERKLQIVQVAAEVIVATEYDHSDFFNNLSGDAQIPYGD